MGEKFVKSEKKTITCKHEFDLAQENGGIWVVTKFNTWRNLQIKKRKALAKSLQCRLLFQNSG
ncbi:MAG: hypothetical protein Q4E16_08000 [Neisseria sp.]|nr:hypothetical protein [Neisseria sp.]